MTSHSVKIYPALLCGVFIFLCLETRSEVTTSETMVINNTTEQPTLHHSVSETQDAGDVHTEKPRAEVRASTLPHTTPSPTTVELNSMNTTTGKSHPESPHNATDKTTAANEVQSFHSTSVSKIKMSTYTEKPTTAPTASPSEDSTTEVKSTEAKPTLTPKTDPKWLSTLATNSRTFPTAPVTTTGLSPKSTLMDSTTPVTAESSPTETALSTISATSKITTGAFIQTAAITGLPSSTVNPTIGTILVSTAKTFSTTIELPLMSQSTSASTPTPNISTTAFPNESTTFTEISPTNVSTALTSNTSEGVLVPIIPKTIPTSKPTKVPESTSSPNAPPCSSSNVVKQCLIIISSLAMVATIFIISTIVLCTKLSSKKYRLKRQQRGTEMMCISSLLLERNQHHYTRHRSPVRNGVLVIPSCGDSDNEGGDNLTVSSFLPDNDRYV